MNRFLTLLIILLVPILLPADAFNSIIKVSDDIEIIKLTPHSYIHVSYTNVSGYGRIGSNGYIYINNKEAVLFDTPMNDMLTKQLIDWLTASLNVKVIAFVPNHWHDDCMGGLNYIHSLNIPSYAHNKTIEIAKQKKLPVPEHGFDDSLTLKAGNDYIICKYYGPAHSSDNIVAWIPSEKVLFAGCMLKDLHAKSIGNISDANLLEWPETIDKLMKEYSVAKIVIPGHGNSGDTALFTHTKELLRQNR